MCAIFQFFLRVFSSSLYSFFQVKACNILRNAILHGIIVMLDLKRLFNNKGGRAIARRTSERVIGAYRHGNRIGTG
jgi:hypothetical protein